MHRCTRYCTSSNFERSPKSCISTQLMGETKRRPCRQSPDRQFRKLFLNEKASCLNGDMQRYQQVQYCEFLVVPDVRMLDPS